MKKHNHPTDRKTHPLGKHIDRKGMTIEWIAKQVGVTDTCIYSILYSKRFPSRDLAKKIYEAMDGELSLNDILGIPEIKKSEDE